MAKTKKPLDTRVPRPFMPADFIELKAFLDRLPSLTTNLYTIHPKETSSFVKVSDDERNYMDDVIEQEGLFPNLIPTTVKTANIAAARLAAKQYRELAASFISWGENFLRNAAHGESYGSQQSSLYENCVDATVKSNTVPEAQIIKNALAVNRVARQRKSASTRDLKTKKSGELPPFN